MKARQGMVVLVVLVLVTLAAGLSSMALADLLRAERRVERREHHVALRELALGAMELEPGTQLEWDGIRLERHAQTIVIRTSRAAWRFRIEDGERLGGASTIALEAAE